MRTTLTILLLASFPLLSYLIVQAISDERGTDLNRSMAAVFVIPLWVVIIVCMYLWLRLSYPRTISRLLGVRMNKAKPEDILPASTASLGTLRVESLADELDVKIFRPSETPLSHTKWRFSTHWKTLIVHAIALFGVGLIAVGVLTVVNKPQNGQSREWTALWFALFLSFPIIGVAHLYGLISRKTIFWGSAILALMYGVLGVTSPTTPPTPVRLMRSILDVTPSVDPIALVSQIGFPIVIGLYLIFFFRSSGRGATLILTLISLPVALLIALVVGMFLGSNSWIFSEWKTEIEYFSFLLSHLRFEVEQWQITILGIIFTCLVQAVLFLMLAVRNYDDCRTSDMELAATSGVLVLYNGMASVIVMGIALGEVLGTRRSQAGLTGPAIFMCMGVAYYLLLDWLRCLSIFGLKTNEPVSLLILRVFNPVGRVRSLVEDLARLWRFQGPVYIISGYEVAMQTMSPRSCILFLTRRLHKLCFTTKSIPTALPALFKKSYFRDGTFRIHDCFCDEHSWRDVFRALLHKVDRILLDLRGINSYNAGILYELEQVVQLIPFDRFIILVDKSSDLQSIRNALLKTNQIIPPSSRLRCFEVDQHSPKESEFIFHLLYEAGKVPSRGV